MASTGNAFDWKGKPSIFTKTQQRGESLKQITQNALRENADASLGHTPKPQRRRRKVEIK